MSITEDLRLSYAFAKEKGVVLFREASSGVQKLGVRTGANPLSLIEARRVVGVPLDVEQLDQVAFDRRLSEVYATEGIDSSDIDNALEGEIRQYRTI